MEKTEISQFQRHLARANAEIPLSAAEAAIQLGRQGLSIPAIARFHANAVQGLSEEKIQEAIAARDEFDEIEKHQNHLLREIKAQNQLTPELEEKIRQTTHLALLDDLYLPYKLKGRTIATLAKEAGLQAFADWIWKVGHGELDPAGVTLEAKAAEFVKPDTSYATPEQVVSGAQNILVERIAENSELRSLVRQSILRKSKLRSEKGPKAKDKSRFQRFFDYREPIGSLKKTSSSQRYLTMRKGWAANELILSFERADEGVLGEAFDSYACSARESIAAELLLKAARLALNGNVFTGIEHDAHKMLKEGAEDNLIQYFSKGLRKRLLQAPYGKKSVLGVDPGVEAKSACLALVDGDGSLLVPSSFPLDDDAEWEKFRPEFETSLAKVKVSAVAVLHGPKGKLARRRFDQVLKSMALEVPLVMIYEQAATIYSTSAVAKEELPDVDPGVRRAVFTARLLQDPLRELVKVDPKFLATGAFQFDIHSAKLGKALYRAIQSCVCEVGVDLNTGSRSALAYLPGFDHNIAKAVIAYRKARGKFQKLEDVRAAAEVNERVYEAALGCMRLDDSKNPLDRTGLRPSDYAAVTETLAAMGANVETLTREQVDAFAANPAAVEKFGEHGARAAQHRLVALVGDVRGEYKPFVYNVPAASLAEIAPDTKANGIITNITSFGVFVDVGLEQDGLVHISEFADTTSPYEELAIGDEASVWIQSVNTEKNQLSLSLKAPEERRPRRRPAGGRGGDRAPRQGGPRKPRAPREPLLGPDGKPLEGEALEAALAAQREARGSRRPPRDRGAPRPPRAPRPARAPILGPDGKPLEGEALQAALMERSAAIRAGSGATRGRREREGAAGGAGGGERGRRPDGPPAKKKPPQRDPKTGAVMKIDDSVYTSKGKREERTGERFQTKAKATTFNPFANLGNILKNKQDE